MPDAVNPRPYNAARRQDAARQRRHAVLQAALELITQVGYAAMTMAGVARRAGVSVEFIYKAFVDKPGLTRQLLDFAAGGDDNPIPVAQRPEVAAMIAESDPAAVLRKYAAMATAINGRAASLLLALAAAAPANESLAEIWRISQQQRLGGAGSVVANVADKGVLRVHRDEARDIIWTLSSPDVFRLLTDTRGWSRSRYEQWLADSFVRDVLAEAPGPAAR